MITRNQTMLVQLEANVTWQGSWDPQSREYMAICPALNLNAGGETWEELNIEIQETMKLLFEDLFSTGELEEFLRRNGWRARSDLPPPGARPKFDVPFDLQQVGELAAHVA